MSLIFSESWTCLPLFFLPPPMSPSAPSRHTNFARPSLSPLRGDRKLRSAPAENSARARSRLAGAREIDEFSFTSLETIQSHPLTFFFSPLSTLPLFSLQHTFHNSPPRRRRPPRCPPCRRRRRVSDGRELRAKKSRMNELFFFNFFVRLSAIVTQLIDSFFFFSSSAFFFLFFADPLSLNPPTHYQKKKKKKHRSHLVPIHSASAGGPYSWLRKDPLVLAIGFLGWTVPAASPSPSFGGGSLFGSLLAETSKGLAEFPTPPSIDSPFWIYLVTCEFYGSSAVLKRERERKRKKRKRFRSLLLFHSTACSLSPLVSLSHLKKKSKIKNQKFPKNRPRRPLRLPDPRPDRRAGPQAGLLLKRG